jgi:electron transport complex protein RnfB
MHTVIAADCPGCELCLAVCPVDCIHMVPAPGLPARPLAGAEIDARAPRFRRLYDARLARLAAAEAEQQRALRASLPGDGAQGR